MKDARRTCLSCRQFGLRQWCLRTIEELWLRSTVVCLLVLLLVLWYHARRIGLYGMWLCL